MVQTLTQYQREIADIGRSKFFRQRWGRASFDRAHRFVFSATWTVPSPNHGLARRVTGRLDWSCNMTIQSGTALTIADTNATNVFGISKTGHN